jgi:hypothetical protein
VAQPLLRFRVYQMTFMPFSGNAGDDMVEIWNEKHQTTFQAQLHLPRMIQNPSSTGTNRGTQCLAT